MSAVVLTILGDNTGARRAIAETRSDYSRTVDGMGVAARRAAAERRRLEADEIADARRVLRAQHQERLRAFQARQRAEEAAAKQRARAAQVEVAETARAEKEKTKAAERESKLRAQLATREAANKERESRREASNTEREERRKTKAAERESRRRTSLAEAEARKQVREAERVRRAWGSSGRSGGVQVFNTGVQAAGQAHGAIQAPRMEMAQIQSTLASAFGEGGATREEITSAGGLQEQVFNFAGREGIDPEQLARSLQGAQQQFSSLAGRDATARRAALGRALNAAKLAHDTQSNPEEVMRLQGALDGVGPENAVNGALRAAIGIARRGGVEIGSLSSQNLSTIRANMSSAVANLRRENPRATEGDSQRAMVDSFTQTLAELEAIEPRGLRGRQAGTANRQLKSSLHDTRTQRSLLTRLRGEFGRDSEQVSRFFTFDERGNASLRPEFLGVQGAENFGRAITTTAGGDPDRIRSLLGRGQRKGDRGEVFHANQREYLALMAGQNSKGRTGWDDMAAIREGARDVTDEDIARTRDIVQGSDATNLTRTRVQGMRSAREPSWWQRASDRASDFATSHPLLTALGGPVAGVLGQKTFGAIGAKLAPALAGGGGMAIAGLAALSTASMVNSGRTAVTGKDLGGQEVGSFRRVLSGSMLGSVASGETGTQLGEMIARAIVRELRANPLTARIDPHDAQHAKTGGSQG